MSKSRVDVVQLRKRDLVAWTALLNRQPELEGAVATAVTAHPFSPTPGNPRAAQNIRYYISLAGQSDPITLVGRRTTPAEIHFYRAFADHFPFLIPRPWLAQTNQHTGWLLIDDVPNDFPPHQWHHNHIEDIITELTAFQAAYWDKEADLAHYKAQGWLPHFIDREGKCYGLDELRQQKAIYFEQGPAAVLSEHALSHAGRLAPTLLEAANGLVVMRDLGGWPGVLGESHLQAAADLLDDPVPLLEPLRNLPITLLHGNPHPYQWHLTLFEDLRLLNWDQPQLGPGIYDLVCFLEQYDLLYLPGKRSYFALREQRPSSEETIIDSYLLALSNELGTQSNTRALRRAIPAARCLYVLLNWFPYFASWFNQMPDKYTWQKMNRLSDHDLQNSQFESLIFYRPYLAGVFERFLRAYHSL